MIIKDEVYISVYDTMRTLHIYVPDDLEDDERCKVIYMFDGHNLFDDEDATYGKSWGLRKYFEKTGDRVIVVGIECNHEGNMRLSEFSPYDFEDPYFGFIEGMGKELVDWMCYELKPFIDDYLPTLTERENTFVGGSSMGGLMAIYAGLAHGETFSGCICVSPYIHYTTNQLLKDMKWVYPDTSFYISWGSKEEGSLKDLLKYQDNIFRIQRKLNKVSNIYLHQYRGHRHCEADWEKETRYWMKDLGI